MFATESPQPIELHVAICVPGSQRHIKYPDKRRPSATSDKVSEPGKLLTA